MKELTKEKRIKDELTRLSKHFENIADNKRSVVDPLLQNAAFMRVTLEDLQKRINEEGATDEYQNGANQYGQKQSAALQSYNALVKNYASIIKQLFGLLPYEADKTDVLQKWGYRTKTPEELERERETAEERTARINAEINAAAERQRQERERNKTNLS